MRTVKPQAGANIKDLLRQHPRRTVITARAMLKMGVSREAQRSMVRSGWLRRMGTGAYAVLDDVISLDGALYALQADLGLSVHEGGFSALAGKHGMTHNLVGGRPAQLFCARGEKMPAWFTASFGGLCAVHTVTVFDPAEGLMPHDTGEFTVRVSSPERAMMEMLYLAPDVHTLEECYQVMELLVAARPSAVQTMLETCRSVKVKRLFLYMADLAGHAWLKRLDIARVDLGSGVREITKGGSLDRRYRLIIGEVRTI